MRSGTTMNFLLALLLSLSLADAFVPQVSSRVYSRVASQTQKHSEHNNSEPNNTEPNNNGIQHKSSGSTSVWDKVSAAGERIDRVGLSLKPKAKHASVLSKSAANRGPKIRQMIKAILCYFAYVWYTAIRGVAVIMPPVYRQLYAKFANLVEYPFDDPIMMRDTNPETGKLRWRTRLNVGLLAGVLSASYVMTGAVRVLRKFFVTARQSRSFLDSIAAAVEQQEENEFKMKRMGDRPVPKPKNYF